MNAMFLIPILLFGTTATDAPAKKYHQAAKQACQTKPNPKAYSSWRTIDGKQCWYRGDPGMARESLYWTTPKRVAKHKAPEVVPLPPTPPPAALPEDLTARLNYYFAVLSSQTYLTTPSGALPLAMAGPWLGTPIPPGLQPVPPPPAGWTGPAPEPEPVPTSWWKRLWEKWPWWWRN